MKKTASPFVVKEKPTKTTHAITTKKTPARDGLAKYAKTKRFIGA